MKRVVLITPVFDRTYLEQSTESVLANNCDAIIVNDSKEPLAMKGEGITIINNEANLGIGISRDRGVQKALEIGYQFIGFVDADSVLSKNWLKEITNVLQKPGILGVSGLALNPNQRSRIARIKFLFKKYSRRHHIPFQIDCSLFHRVAFEGRQFSGRRFGEDAFFLRQLNRQQLAVCPTAISYHYETERVGNYFEKEILGALYSVGAFREIGKNFLLTLWTTRKMAALRRQNADYPWAALLWLFRQPLWFFAYIIGRLSKKGKEHTRRRPRPQSVL